VVWSPAALEDVEAIAAYIARDSAQYASAVVQRLRDTARSLREFPLSGRTVPEFDDASLREKLVYNYRLIYRIETEVVTIAAVVHGKQSFVTGVGRLRGA
ncbi:MAG: type II toxin-antitoxin system RelE/ParE family toxin, partial [Gemmatimonadota bacterium]|nr:type II toxin-antitoxin system RelE/ParE family toxin [Gemmatimonadota bacterium]